MDLDDAIPPPIRRGSREIQALYEEIHHFRLSDDDADDDDDYFDQTATPPVRRQRASSEGTMPSTAFSKPIAPPLPSKSPLRLLPEHLLPEPLHPTPKRNPRNFSHPFKEHFQAQRTSKSPHLPPLKPLSYRRKPRLPVSLRRWSSLETIDSVTTTTSIHEDRSDDCNYPLPMDPPQTRIPRPEVAVYQPTRPQHSPEWPLSRSSTTASKQSSASRYRILDDEEDPKPTTKRQEAFGLQKASTTPKPTTNHAPSLSSASSSSLSILTPTLSPVQTRSNASSKNSSPSSPTHARAGSSSSRLIRKLKSRAKEPLLDPPLHLEIEKRIDFDQSSTRTSSVRTSSSGSIMTISSGRPDELLSPSMRTPTQSTAGSASLSQSSSKTVSESGDWKSSSFDTSTLSEAELKKCKKKGINPALYAEMKAARKGKFVSPIGGNTFL